MSDDAVKQEEKIGKIWTAIEKLWAVVLGNGAEGHEQRIQELETLLFLPGVEIRVMNEEALFTRSLPGFGRSIQMSV